jgi:GxxExxY protein
LESFLLKKMKCSVCQKEGHTKRSCPGVEVKEVEVIPASSFLDEDELQKMEEIIEMMYEVATNLRKGRSESVYQNAILIELQERNIKYTAEEVIPITYKGKYVGTERIDIALQSWLPLIFELKAVSSEIKPENFWQILSYMRTKEMKLGAVVNFNQSLTKDIEVEFVLLKDDKPYKLDIVSDTATPIQDYDYMAT